MPFEIDGVTLYSLADVAQKVGKEPGTVRRWLKTKDLTGVGKKSKASKQWLFTESDVKKIVNYSL